MAKSLHKYTVVEAQNASLGQAGVILIDDTAEHAGPFVAIQALADAVVDVSECDMSFIEDNLHETWIRFITTIKI